MIKKFKIISTVAAVLFGGQVMGSGSDAQELLKEYVAQGHYDRAIELIDKEEIDPNTIVEKRDGRFSNTGSVLAHVCYDEDILCEKKLSLVKRLIEKGADFNHKFAQQYYPLDCLISPCYVHYNTYTGYFNEAAGKIGKYRPVMEYLLEKGANVSVDFFLLALFAQKEDWEIMLRYKSDMLSNSLNVYMLSMLFPGRPTQKAMDVIKSLAEYRFNFETAYFNTGEEMLPSQPHIPGKTVRLFEEISRRSLFTVDVFKFLINQGGVDFNNYDRDEFIDGLRSVNKPPIKAYIEEHFPIPS